MSNTTMECPICVDSCYAFNIVTCPSCEHKACKACYKTYILSSERDTISCMSCGVIFNRSTIMSLFGKSFLTKTFLDYQKEVRFKQNKAMFPEVLPIVENELECRRIKVRIKAIQEEIADICMPFRKQIREIEEKMEDAIRDLKTEKQDLTDGYKVLSEGTYRSQSNRPTVSEYTRPCLNDECKGFLNTQFKCGICNSSFCKDCYEHIDTGVEHECDPNIKESVKLMKRDTKNCPSCGTGIYKIDGCNQMFCTKCHTAFDWKTGRVCKGIIHNPHYYEYLRETREVMPTVEEIAQEAAAAGGRNNRNHCFDRHRIVNILKGCVYKQNRTGFNRYTNCLIDLVRIPDHIDDHIGELRRNNNSSRNNQRKNRVKFLLDDITRKQFDTEISKDLKKIEFNQEIILLMETVRDVTRDSIARTSEDIRTEFNPDASEQDIAKVIAMIMSCIKEVNGIFTYATNAFDKLRDCYQSQRSFPLDGFLDAILETHEERIPELQNI